MRVEKSVIILGTRGIPAAHGGFETFVEQLAVFLVDRGWHVIAYCQNEVDVVSERITHDFWNGVERRHVNVASRGPKATLEFDWHSIVDAVRNPGLCLIMGYNSGLFIPYLRLHGRTVMTNMDGIEWQRRKWGTFAKAWLWANEWIAAWSSQRLVADHPRIADHLSTRRGREAIVMIPYGGTAVRGASCEPVRKLGLDPGEYLISIARVEPDNNSLLIVEAFSHVRRNAKLLVLGMLNDENPYHRRIREAASDEVIFAGAIYDHDVVAALRFHSYAYLHGHTVGGTNPSLVEALWAGNAVIAHDNHFNRWTAGNAGLYFRDFDECEALIDRALRDRKLIAATRLAARRQAERYFRLQNILEAYEQEAVALLSERASWGALVSAPGNH